jgi:glutaminase
VLSVMTTCGMYNYAGQWLYDVGIPAKSGVAGGILAVLPGRMGIAAFSPKLDVQGNSVRGVKACHELSQRFGLHLFSAHRPGRSVIRSETTLQSRASSRVRPAADAVRLKSEGASALLIELQGDLHFSAMERVQRRVWDLFDQFTTIVFDFARVDAIDAAVVAGMSLLSSTLMSSGRQVVFSSLGHSPRGKELGLAAAPSAVHTEFDRAIEACEDSLLSGQPIGFGEEQRSSASLSPTLAVADLDVAAGLDESELKHLQGLLIRHRAEAGHAICRMGDAANELYFLSRGTVSVRLPHPSNSVGQRLAVFGAGSVFGEVAVIDHGPRSADVWTESPAEYYSLSVEAFEGLDTEFPSLKIKVLRYLLGMITFRLRRANNLIGQIAR